MRSSIDRLRKRLRRRRQARQLFRALGRERPAPDPTWVIGARDLIHRLARFEHIEEDIPGRPTMSCEDEIELIQRARGLAGDDPEGWPTPDDWGK